MEIPKEVLQIAEILKQNKFEAYLVGGCVRDLLLETEPNDWDLCTNAKPEKLQELFPDNVYENEFGTVAVKTDSEDPTLKLIEVTTYRIEEGFSNKRHPDKVRFTSKIEDDLSRRDFTVNAIAMDLVGDGIKDPFDGQEDLKNKIIRAVGDPEKRFQEDALRLMRALRFSAQLGFVVEEGTEEAIKKNAQLLEHISQERIRIELEKLIMSGRAHEGIENLEKLDLLQYVMSELREGIDVEQNMHHVFSVFEHAIKSLEYATQKDFSAEVRMAALLHDVGKPKSRRWKAHEKGEKIRNGKKGDWTFYGHQVVGARMVKEMLGRLTYSKKFIDKVETLVHEHMFVYDPDMVTLAGVRRLVARVGEANLDDLMKLREADRIGSGVPKAQPYRLRHLMAMMEKVRTDPVSTKMLKINGHVLMDKLEIPAGPRLGDILDSLLEEILEEPIKNTEKKLLERANALNKLNDKELTKLAEKGQNRAKAAQDAIDKEIKDKYFVK